MKLQTWKWIAGLSALALVTAACPVLRAECGLPNKPIKPSSWSPLHGTTNPQFVASALIDFEEPGPSIVGMWHVIFTAHSSGGEPIPSPGAVIDNSMVVWHADGTEIMNSSRSAQDGNFCLGVWKCTGNRTYLLNHIPWQGNVFDPTVPADTIGAPQDGAQLIEKITLAPDGDSYTGTFTLNAYNSAGGVYASFVGTLSAKRVTPETPFSALL
jgi:hypothetical protein